jgi:hypothetical protein
MSKNMNKTTYCIIGCHPDRGMKSYGHKSLIQFGNKSIIDYQIKQINKVHNQKYQDYEIIIITNSYIDKLLKHISRYNQPNIRCINNNKYNPVYQACVESVFANILFIDYGCLFNSSLIEKIMNNNMSTIACSKDRDFLALSVGCLIENNKLIHMFLDIVSNKFTNIFSIKNHEKNYIINNQKLHRKNFLYFEIINMLLDDNINIDYSFVSKTSFFYFNHMRQKHGTTQFIKQYL